jgi:hypothetical protein
MEPRNRTQREPQSLEAWESWVDKLIVDAQERGDFDDLPGHGKPLKIEDAPFAGGLEVGFGILKNAGVAPYWVELEKEMRAAGARLDETASRAAQIATTAAPEPIEALSPRISAPRRPWWWPFRRAAAAAGRHQRANDHSEPNAAEIERLRRDYLEQAETLDRLIAQYNAAIPRELWQLERPRLTREEAAREFDARTAVDPDMRPETISG